MNENLNKVTDSCDIGGFKTIRLKCEEGAVEFRSAISTEAEAKQWIDQFSKKTLTQWLVRQTYPNVKKLAYHKRYECAFSCKNKKLLEGSSRRNYNCKVNLNMKIKLLTKDTVWKDQWLRESPPLTGVITIKGLHNHNKDCSTITNYFRPGDELRQTFEGYFHNGMGPAKALTYQEVMLLTKEDGAKLVANGHYMPLMQTVYYWHKEWRMLNFGPTDSPLDTLRQKMELYKEKGVTVIVRQDEPWAVLVVTPVMERTQHLYMAKSIIFVDSSASCDATSCNVTIINSTTKAGAVPLCILLHEAQTSQSYEIAFSLFKETFPRAFGGEDHPVVFMSDNSAAEKKALKTVWPDSVQLLCDFHIGQAEWHWLHSHVHGDQKRTLMKAFQKIQKAVCTEDLEEATSNLISLSQHYYDSRVKGLLQQKEEWVRLFRANLPTMGNNTNNYSEVTVRILKDIILERIKAFNPAALVDYIIEGWDPYLQSRLGRYASKRESKPQLLYDDLVKRMPDEYAKNIVRVDADTFIVPNSRDGRPTYEVSVKNGTCMCSAGTSGAFCKHQALVHRAYGSLFPSQPPVNSADRYLLGKLAFGSKCPEKSFFLDPKETLGTLEKNLKELMDIYQISPAMRSQDMDVSLVGDVAISCQQLVHDSNISCGQSALEENDDEDGEKLRKEFGDAMDGLYKLGAQSNRKGFHKFFKILTTGVQKVTTENKAFDTVMRMSAAVKKTISRGRSELKIRIQPSSQQRRRPGITRGSARIPAGRPPKNLHINTKRKRRLAESINSNVAHVKKH